MNLAAVVQKVRDEREAWKYTRLEGLKPETFAAAAGYRGGAVEKAAPSFDALHRLVFVNGAFCRELSHLGVLPLGLGDAAGYDYHLALEERTCLVVSPIELVFVTQPEAVPTEAATRLRITLGASGRLTLLERHVAAAGTMQAARMIETRIELGPQAKLVHGKIFQDGEAALHFARTEVCVAEGAYYDNFTLLRGGKPARNEIDVTLAGAMAQCNLGGVMLLRGAEHADTQVRVTHAAPHGTSRQVYKSVIGGKGRGVFQGKIVVAEGAQKTDGHQLCRALLLSDQAEMDAKPELEIYADDVKCSHGAAVGDLDEDALFYLQARGIAAVDARALLVAAFVDEVVGAIQVADLRAMVREEIGRWSAD